jgi:hypothetical protein
MSLLSQLRLLIKVFLMIILLTPSILKAQTRSIILRLEPTFGNQPLVLDTPYYPLPEGDSLQITNLKFYLSHIELKEGQKIVWTEPNSFHLVDMATLKSLVLVLDIPKSITFDAIKFNLGIDSLTNIEGAKGGDLDPTKGMYWSWQGGYINFKLEGISRNCPTRKNKFQFHIGGFLEDEYAIQTMVFPLTKSNLNAFVMEFDVQKFLSVIDFKTQNNIMSPSTQAVDLAKKLTRFFTLKESLADEE